MTMVADSTSQSLAAPLPQARQIVRVQDESQFSMFLDTARFEHAQRVAKMFSESTMVPEHYRQNIGNCFIALQMAVRLGVDPFMFMQKSYVVHGKPGIEAQLAIALINSSGLFTDALDFEINGDDPDNPFDESYKVRAWAVRKSTGKKVNGPWIDWKLVRAEGWFDKSGSKWKTMPEQMFMYRAASYFGRLHCPERLMGMLTQDELNDIDPVTVAAPVAAGGNKRLAQAIAASVGDAPAMVDAEPVKSEPAKPATVSPSPGAKPAATQQTPTTSRRPGPKRQPASEVPAEVPPAGEPDTSEPAPGKPLAEQAEEFVNGMSAGARKSWLLRHKSARPDVVAQAMADAKVENLVDVGDEQIFAVAYHLQLKLLQTESK